MKRPRILVRLMVERRREAERLLECRARARALGDSLELRLAFNKIARAIGSKRGYRLPRITVRSLLHLTVSNKRFARSRWESHDTETYSACGWDDYQIERREEAARKAHEYRKAARFLYAQRGRHAL